MDISVVAFVSLVERVLWASVMVADGRIEVAKFALSDLSSRENLCQLFFLFFVQYAVVKFYRIVLYPHFLSPLRHLPGPKDNHPILGQFLKILLDPSPIGRHKQWHSQWPRAPFIRYLGLFNEETLIINTPEAHKEVLQTHCYSFVKPAQLYRLVGDLTGLGLLFSEGDVHKRHRRALNPLFTLSSLKKILPVFQDSTEQMVEFFEEQLDANGRTVIECVDCFSKVTLDIAGKTMMGVSLDNLASPGTELDFHSSYKRTLQPSPLSALISFVNTAVPVRRWIPLEANLGHVRATQNLRRLVRIVVDERLEQYRDARCRGAVFESPALCGIGRDLLTLMVEESAAAKGSDSLEADEMVDHVLNLLTGGHETSATALTWCMYVLATRPHMQERIRDELRALRRGSDGRYDHWGGVERLPFLHNFLREILRRYPPVVLSFREPIKDVTICGIFIPRGTVIVFNFSQVNLCRTIWGEDADEFRPERWEALKGEATSPYALETFSNGPRICSGKGFALMEIKCVLVDILTRFRVLPTPELVAYGLETPPLQNPSLTIRPKGGLRVVLERLEQRL